MSESWRPVTDIAALRNAIGWPHPVASSDSNSSHLGRLATQAEETLLDGLPLCAIAEAHKNKGDNLMAKGDIEDSGANASAVYVEYLKYLQLYPHDNEEYKRIFLAVHGLERALKEIIDGSTLEREPMPGLLQLDSDSDSDFFEIGLEALISRAPHCCCCTVVH
ncbi:hypothetical protein B0H17DRAFT_1142942 [Mycena rosella]|uniref:Uncharacterized protein n=1 Tax=Mycena rosella TaxID=1033263 RepID=A0AAD7CWQ6_MYCRO|nr:hypothetical protein B0H17DRAFT_1142942 [Mycena rosella]